MSDRSPIEPPRPGGYPPAPGGPSARERSGRGRGPILLVLGALVAAVVLVAGAVLLTRSDSAEEVPLGGPATSVAPAPAAAPTTTDPQAATKAEVIAAYRAGWEEHLAVGRDPNATADDDRLRAHHTGDNLATLQIAMVKFKSAEKVYVGEVKLNPTVVELGPDTATIQDCVDDATGAADATTGEIVEPATRVIKTATAKMKLVGGVWKQANYRSVEGPPCTSAAR